MAYGKIRLGTKGVAKISMKGSPNNFLQQYFLCKLGVVGPVIAQHSCEEHQEEESILPHGRNINMKS